MARIAVADFVTGHAAGAKRATLVCSGAARIRVATNFGDGGGQIMFLALFFILLIGWIAGWLLFHIAGGLIHALLIVP
jgi:hypothetical protein